jgi:hypothetical protein
MRSVVWTAAMLAVALTCAISAGARQPSRDAFAGVLDEHPAIRYATAPVTDRVAQLIDRLRTGARRLEEREPGGYLLSLLDALDISPESQLLVFSKTGIQRAVTGPKTPRALYFNDDTVVGYIPGARFIEMAAHDPQNGVVFYTVDQLTAPATAVRAPDIARRTNCLTCHVSSSTLEVPGMITRGMFTSREGEVQPQLGSHVVDHRTPLPQRWGGWFVTGNYVAPPYGGVGHMGNVTTAIHPTSGPAGTSNEVFVEWLNSAPAARGYPSAESDIAALMLFDHQMHAVNLLTRLNWETRVAVHEGRVDFARGDLASLAQEVADYFLFVDEVPPPARLTPRAGLVKAFAARAVMDRRGRSLRELDFERRLLRYPCSYMIYSAAFEQLPPVAKRAVYERLAAVLTSTASDRKYAHLSARDREAILDILRDTKPDFAAIVPRT